MFEAQPSDPRPALDSACPSCHWRKDLDTYPGNVDVSTPNALLTELRVPNDATTGQTIQLVLEATDNGAPALTRYQRVVVVITR